MSFKIKNTDDFAKLRHEGGYYVDKTGFLEQFLEEAADATLFTRPRRFGKTLLMSMLAEFFDITKDNQELFANLKVAENEMLCREWMNQYPVVSLTLKDMSKPGFERALSQLQENICNFCEQHKYLLSSERVEGSVRKKIQKYLDLEADEDQLALSLYSMTKALFCHYNKRVIVLIDEYDVPVAKAAEMGYYNAMIEFMRGFLSPALKSNPYLKFAILTGCLRITKESIFTGLNNLDCFDILSPEYADVFGFTQDEVDRMLTDAGCEDKRGIIRDWYDGYHFGKRQDIYCPWSIMKYLRVLKRHPEEEPQAYWVNTSGNELTKGFLNKIPATVQDDIASLADGNTIAVEINETVNYSQLYAEEESFWTLLYLTGYLTRSEDRANCVDNPRSEQTLLAIPNREIHKVFHKEIKSWFKDIVPQKEELKIFFNMFWNADVTILEQTLGKRLLNSSSFHDYQYREHFYHALLMGIFLLSYTVTSNREAGNGVYDLTVLDESNRRAAVIELKRADSQEQMETCVQDALQQIADRQYDVPLQNCGYTQIFHWGMAFFKKSCRMGVRCV